MYTLLETLGTSVKRRTFLILTLLIGFLSAQSMDNYEELPKLAQNLYVAYELSDCKDESTLWEAYKSTVQSAKSSLSMLADVEECQRVNSCAADAEQLTDGGNLVICDSDAISDLDMAQVGSNANVTALNWGGWNIPAGAVITSASIQFTALANSTSAAAFTVQGEAADNATLYTTTDDVITRSATAASVNWSPGTWTAGDAGTAQVTPDLTTIIQEIVNRPGYVMGNNIALIISGKGLRRAYSYDLDPNLAPELCITYDVPDPPTSTCDGCPDISVVSLDGVPNFPTVDLLNLCSSPDTASILIYNSGECMLTDVELTLTLDSGLSYGGFVFMDDNSTGVGTVAPSDLSDLTVPVFTISQIDSSEAFIINIAIQADCDVDVESEMDLNFDAMVNFTYSDDNGSTPTCNEGITEVGAYNSGVRVPVLNVRSITPSDLNIPLANNSYCQRIRISQDGIQAFLDGAQFAAIGIDTNLYQISSIDVNDVIIPSSDWTYDNATQTVNFNITADHIGNGDNGYNLADGDDLWEADEQVYVDFCFVVKGCIDDTNFITYQVFYGCNNKVCGDVSAMQGAVNFQPNFGANVQAVDVEVIQEAAVCGQDLIYEGTIRSSNSDPLNGLWEDLIIKYNVCGIGNIMAFEPLVNGVALPAGVFSVDNGVIVLDFTSNTVDFDGPGGLTDEDGDGIFDDLPGGNEITLRTTLSIDCGDVPTCAATSCSISSYEVNGKRNCGQDFQAFGSFTPITFNYGMIMSESNDSIPRYSNGSGGLYSAQQFETVCDWMMVPNGYDITYEYGYENIMPCQDITAIKAEAIFDMISGNNLGVSDYFNYFRYKANSATYNGSPVSDANVTVEPITQMIPDGAGGTILDTTAIKVIIDAGDPSLSIHNYHIDMEVNSSDHCRYTQTLNYSYKVIETCGDCMPVCDITRGCAGGRTIWNWVSCNCVNPCVWETTIDTIERLTFGYADAALTIPIDPATVPEEDMRRFLPGDKMRVRTANEIVNIDVLRELDNVWSFYFYEGISTSESALRIDARNAKFKGWFFEDAQTGVITEIGIPDCYQNYPDATRDNVFYPSIQSVGVGASSYNSSPYNYNYKDENAYHSCVNSPEINPNYPPESAFMYVPYTGSSDDRYDTAIRFSLYGRRPENCPDRNNNYYDGTNGWDNTDDWYDNNCIKEFMDQYDMENGDKILIEYEIPWMHNPNYELGPLNGYTNTNTSRFYSVTTSTKVDSLSCSNRSSGDCRREIEEVYGYIAPDPSVDIEMTLGDCDLEAEHNINFAYTMPDPAATGGGPEWYANEYRPFHFTEKMQLLFPANMVYTGNLQFTNVTSGDIITIPDSYINTAASNLQCTSDPSTPSGLCCFAADTSMQASIAFTGLNYDLAKNTIVYNRDGATGTVTGIGASDLVGGPTGDLCMAEPFRAVVDSGLPTFVIGGGATSDSYRLDYSLQQLCPEDIESTDFGLNIQFVEPYMGDYYNRKFYGDQPYACVSNSVVCGRSTTNKFANRYIINPYGDLCDYANTPPYDATVDGCRLYWGTISADPDESGPSLNPMRSGGMVTSSPATFTDNSMDFPPLLTDIDRLLIPDEAGINEFNTYTVCAGDASGGGATHMNVVTSIEVPNTVQFIDAQDTGGTSLTWTLAQTTAVSKIYTVPTPDLAPGECAEIVIVTELLFCPVGLEDVTTTICASTVSGCLDPAKAAVVNALGEGLCDVVDACYQYVAEEADIQVEWDPQPMGEYGLCETIPMGVRLKNVKPSVLTNLKTDFWYPAGLNFVSGSFQACYPGGPTNVGACVPIADPIADPSKNTIFGTHFGYDDFSVVDSYIHSNGLPGILASQDSNRIQILFEVETVCDEFVSGTSVYHQTLASDPCEATIQSMFVNSDPIIIENANPLDFAQFFVFAAPAYANCGEDATLVLTYLNISPFGESEESNVCIDLETETFDYMSGSVQWLSPASHSPTITEEMNGSITHVCFDIPDGIGPGQAFQISIDFSVPEDINCGAQDLGVAVTSEIMDQSCMELGVECSVYVLNSVNPQIEVDFLPPLNVDDQTLMTKCPNGDGTVDLCYDITFSNPGAFYNGDVTIKLIRDVNLNGIIDDPIIDTELADMDHFLLINTDETASVMGCFTVSEAESCPVFLMITQTTDCVCDNLDYYYDSIEPAINDNMQTEYTLCPGVPFGIEKCLAWDYTVSPAAGASVVSSSDNDSLYITLNAGFGTTAPVVLTVTSQSGGCQEFEFPIELYSLSDFEFGPFAGVSACNVGCRELSLSIPSQYEENVSVEWFPNQYLDDNTSLTPTICNPEDDVNYFVQLTFTNQDGTTCLYDANYPVTVEEQIIEEVIEDANLCNETQATIEAPSGYSTYNWIRINADGSETTVDVSGSNTYTAVEEGRYYVTYQNLGAVCATRSNEFIVNACLLLEKSITAIVPTGTANEYTVSYTVSVENPGSLPGEYDVYDEPGFDTDIVASAASFTTDAPGVSGAGLPLPAPASPGWLMGDDVAIAAMTTHTYTVNYIVSIDLGDGGLVDGGDDEYSPCGGGSGPANAGPGEALYNNASLDLDNDPTDPEVEDDDCGELPFLTLDKEIESVVSTSNGCYDVRYWIKVTNEGGADGEYDLTDEPGFDDDIEINAASYDTDAVGNPGGSLPIGGTSYVLADDQVISAGKVDSFALLFAVCLDLADASSAGDEVYTGCGSATPGVPTAGEGLFNTAKLDVNNDGEVDEEDEVCADLPYLILEKTYTSTTGLADGSYDVVFTLTVENLGGTTELYDLFDLPEYEDDIVINGASYASDVPSSGTLAAVVPAAPGWELADDVSIAPGVLHTYTLTVNVDLGIGDGIGDDDYTACGDGGTGEGLPGEGLFNTASLDVGGEGTVELTDEVCADLEIVDVALIKQVTTPGPYTYGDIVEFEIEVFNQGNITLTDILVTDYVPCGFVYSSGSQPWTAGSGSNYETTITGPLAPNTSTTVGILLEVVACGSADAYLNIAEVTSMSDGDGEDVSDDDIDSTPDATVDNDAGGEADTDSDNVNGGDGSGNPGDEDPSTDEDDQDPALIEVFDLALTKVLDTAGPYNYGDELTFTIELTNQGNVMATDILVTDYVPSGYSYVSGTPAWVAASGSNYETTIAGPLAPGASTTVEIVLEVGTDVADGNDSYINVAEISSALDGDGNPTVDADSTPDATEENDAGGEVGTDSDDVVDGDGTGVPGDEDPLTDEDDQDPAGIQIVDVALTKVVNTPGPYSYGDVVNFDIEVFNQGSVTLTDIEVIDYPNCGYSYVGGSATTWVASGSNYVATIPGPIAPGSSVTVSINYEVIACTSNSENAYLNVAEVTGMSDEEGNDVSGDDVDSTPDADVDNDGGGSVDTDSDNVVDGDGTGVPGDEVPGTDEDDQDPAQIEIFDLALQKVLTTTPPFAFGDMVVFTIEVFNQGNVVATDVVVSDYVPVGFGYDAGASVNVANGWSSGPNPTTTIAGPIMPGTSATVQIELEFMTTGGGPEDWWNYAEIVSALDGEGNATEDVDSTPDNDPDNDNPVQPGDGDDNNIDGDSTQGEDEDDHDPADIFTVVDVALQKTLSTPPPYTYGQVLTYTIEVFNQGNMDLQNIEVTDYVPCGLSYVGGSQAWTVAANGTDYATTIAGPLMAGTSTSVTIDLEVIQCTSSTENAFLNYAEVSYMEDDMGNDVSDDDVDSNADNNDGNDVGGTPDSPEDDHVDDDGMDSDGDGITDEDDHDPVLIEIFDLALTKVLDTPAPYAYGDDLSFTIEVTNQGNVTATDILITDYIPSGFSYVGGTPAWTVSGSDATTTIAGPLAAGTSTTVEIVLELIADNADGDESWINVAEITSAVDGDGNPVIDIDSTPDGTESNDAGGQIDTGSDDVVDGDATGNPGDEDPLTDEDDQDPAGIFVVDVALAKTTLSAGPYTWGDEVEFNIEVINQGSVTLTDIEVTDYIPCGFTYLASNDGVWTFDAGTGNATTVIAGPLAPQATMNLQITLELTMCDAPADAWTNVAEVSEMYDEEGTDVTEEDIDSDSDDTEGNDGGGNPDGNSDDVVDGDGTGNPGDDDPATDEDDSDPEFVEIFDLALTKTIGSEGPYEWLEDITYDVNIFNQGNEFADNIVVTDYFPSCFTLNDSDWTDNGDSTAEILLSVANGGLGAPLAPGQSITVPITLTVGVCSTQEQVNYAEITSATDEEGSVEDDVDSTPDATNGNDAGGEEDTDSDDVVDGDGTGVPGDEEPTTDEDDHDPEDVLVVVPVWDLALIKALSLGQPNPVEVGDEVSFDIQVTNQGTETADNIVITDYLPSCMTLTDSDWVDQGDGTATQMLSVANGGLVGGPLAPGQSVLVDITFTVDACATGTIMNWAEISDFTDEYGDEQEDDDSTPDNDEDNDNFDGDDNISDNGMEGGDEDDHDPADITIIDPVNMTFDLALTKTLTAGQSGPFGNGATVTYDINVENQGNIAADNIEVIDYLPSCFVLTDPDWTDNGDGTASIVLSVANGELSTPLQPGMEVTKTITVTLSNCAAGDIVNYAEIADATDENGDPVDDIDSTPDDTNGNDAGGNPDGDSDDVNDGDGSGEPGDDDPTTDEDDHDPEVIQVDPDAPMDFDLALTKVLTPGQSMPVSNGDLVSFQIMVFNQGDVAADNIDVTDYMPSCMSLSDSDWTDNGDGTAVITLSVANGGLATPLLPGDDVMVQITLSVDSCSDGTETNWAEISDATDGAGNPVDDIDSTPDDTNDDPYQTDNDTSGDGTDDEDDHDPADIPIENPVLDTFDLALTKMLDMNQVVPVTTGDLLTFNVTVYNQGNVSADNIDLVDYLPACFTLSDGNWTAGAGNTATRTLSVANGDLVAPLAPGQNVAVPISVVVGDCGAAGTVTNYAEITGATDEDGDPVEDVDSDPDSNPDNDGDPVDDATEDPNDEDDHDPEDVPFIPVDEPMEEFDLALNKTLAPGQANPVTPGSSVTYNVLVVNQGDVLADNIELIDYLPTCATLNDADWTAAAGNTATIMLSVANGGLTAPLDTGDSVTVPITITLGSTCSGTVVNYAEISGATDENGDAVTDVDSTPDATNGNDAGGNPDGNSDDVLMGDGTGTPGGDTPGTDEDDHDPETIEVTPAAPDDFDLALTKTLSSTQVVPVQNGDLVVFEIEVTNQGDVAADNISVVDYMPGCMTLSDPNWTAAAGNTAVTTLSVANGGLTAPLQPSQSITVFITLEVVNCANGDVVNYAEISGATDGNGDPVTDVDSNPDNNNGNDAGGNPDGNSDDVIDGDGAGNPGDDNPNTDEDDHDPAVVPVDNTVPNPDDFDLALIKELSATQTVPVVEGDIVTFDITVYNQGDVSADNIEVIDYIPSCLSLSDANWTAGAGNTATQLLSVANGGLNAPLAPSQSVTVSINLLAGACTPGTVTNYAEISGATDGSGDPVTDIDSTPDGTNGNDAGGNPDGDSDNVVNGDGEGTPGGDDPFTDEDDHDPATFPFEEEAMPDPEFDLALVKTLAPGQVNPAQPGSVTFQVTVFNQGEVIADNIEVTDYMPSCASLNDPNWTDNGDGSAVRMLSVANGGLATPLAVNASVSVLITLDMSTCTGTVVNWAEISDATDGLGNPVEDIDSTPDDTQGNDTYTTDNGTSGDGNNGGDEDDHDPEEITINPNTPMDFDLALIKTLASFQTTPVANGDLVSFEITVFNQGDVAADNIEVIDYMPSCMILNDADWTDNGDGTASKTLSVANGELASPLLPGAQTSVIVTLELVNCTDGVEVNYAEISEATDGNGDPVDDVDSDPDDNPDNDGDPVDDATEDPDDEDDHDPAEIPVLNPEEPGDFDLALIKVLAPGQSSTVMTGDFVDYEIYVINQGEVAADNISVVDYIPSCFTLADGDWTDNGDGTASMTISVSNGFLPNALLPGTSVAIPITLRVGSCSGTSQTNWAEITDATDNEGNPVDDVDSTPDDTDGNDPFGEDDQTDGDGTDDEDDNDPETVEVQDELEETFDLALTKTLPFGQSGTVPTNSVVTFNVNVFNQGTIPADNIEVIDYLPSCAVLQDPNWIDNGDGTASRMLSVANGDFVLALAPGQQVTVQITMDFAGCPVGSHTNWAEISGATDNMGNTVSDIDSTPDDSQGNDAYGDDNQTNGNGVNDEDDHDPETIMISPVVDPEFDLALIKTLSAGQLSNVANGSVVVYDITIFNQGNVAADDIEVIDYLPACMDLVDPNWFYDSSTHTAVRVISVVGGELTSPLGPGQSITVPVSVQLNGCPLGSLENWAEIEEATDGNGDPVTDIDSTPDDDQTNDEYGDDNQLDGDGTDDEDDHDPEMVQVMNPIEVPNDFDLALIKILAPGQINEVQEGDFIKFRIQVTNQGDVAADNVSINDYFPSCTSLADTNWTDNGDGSATTMLSVANGTLMSPLTPGQSMNVDIRLLVGDCGAGEQINWAEITGATDGAGGPVDDIDSTPDDDPDNDTYTTDNETNEDGNNGGDEDDHDPEVFEITPIFDLALTKTVTSSGPYSFGDNVDFAITVYNQGNVQADNIEITDYMPIGYTFNAADNPGWTDNGDGTLTYVETTLLGVNSSTIVPLTLELVQTSGGSSDWINYAEISDATDENGDPQEDVDSQMDDFPDNDNDVVPGDENDDVIDEDPGTPGEDDEDDHDPAGVDVFDLAQIKTTNDDGPFSYGDEVTFTMTVYNQGNVPASNVVVNDFIPCGMEYLASNNGTWTYNAGTGIATTTLGGVINPGSSAFVEITLEVQECYEDVAAAWTNISEIESATDDEGNPQEDSDSDPDDDPTNDGDPEDDEVDGDPSDPENPDEDDHDPETIDVFDLALQKQLVTGAPYSYGQVLEFSFNVINQGNVDAYNVELTDYLPSGYLFDGGLNVGWTQVGDNLVYNVSFVAAASTEVVSLYLELYETGDGEADYYNGSEISDADDNENPNDEDPEDADSDPDNDPENDNPVDPGDDNDDEVEDTPNDPQGPNDDDEDDSDPAAPAFFDLAIVKKVVEAGPYIYGDVITYTFDIYNQGTIDAYDIGLVDYLPCGLIYMDSNDASGWSYNSATGMVTRTVSGPLLAGEVTQVTMRAQVKYCEDAGAWYNAVEITGAEDENGVPQDDIDSDPDNDPNNDGDPTDDNINNDNDDEDDHDPMEIDIFDLAYTKRSTYQGVDSIGPFVPGDIVDFAMSVTNQGNVAAYNVQITDYLNHGYIFNNELNPGWTLTSDGLVQTIIPGPIAVGQTYNFVLQLEVVVPDDAELGDWYNEGEISSGDDENGSPQTDSDSTPDEDPDNDNDLVDGPDDDEVFNNGDDNDNEIDEDINDPYNEGDDDEDDNDAAEIIVVGKLCGIIWNDCNGDGVQNDFNSGMAGVVVDVFNEEHELMGSVITNNSGFYELENLLPGLYYVKVNKPAEYYVTDFKQGTILNIDSDLNDANGECTTPMAYVRGGECDKGDFDAGLYECIPIGELVWYDINKNDVKDSYENGINGLPVQLWKLENGVWTWYETKYTGHKPGTPSDDGYFKFCAPPGTYEVRIDIPEYGLVPTRQNMGTNGSLPLTNANESAFDSDVSFGQSTGAFTIDCNTGDVCNIGAGYYPMAQIGNRVWVDANEDGMQSATEQGIAGVKVEAYDANDNMINSAVTDGAGEYMIDYLGADDYYLKFTPPNNYLLTSAKMGGDDNMDSDVDGSNGQYTTQLISLNSGDSIPTVDAGLVYRFGVVPIELLSFTGENRGNYNELEWETAREVNSSHFVIERSLDSTTEFVEIGKVMAAGNSSEVNSYDMRDYDIELAGGYYYRLKLVDINESFSYSETIKIDIERAGAYKMDLYPNPARSSVNLDIDIPTAGMVKVSIWDAQGKLVSTNVISEEMNAGLNTRTLDIRAYAAGMYSVKIEVGNTFFKKKLIILKD